MLILLGSCTTEPQVALDDAFVDPPAYLHAVLLPDADRLVFSRSFSPLVTSYEVCWDNDCAVTTTNYVDFAPGELPAVITVQGLLDDGGVTEPSAFDLADALLFDLTLPAPPHGPTASSGSPPTVVYSPVFGAQLEIVGGSDNTTSGAWGLWQHKSGYHRAGGGLNGSNDLYAWDVNLRVTNAYLDADKGMEFFPVGFGWVRTWAGKAPGGNASGEVLIDHSGWWSGYLHADTLSVTTNDYVTPATRLGRIGKKGNTNNNHLHLAVYKGTNTSGGLTSYDVSFITNPVTISFAAGASSSVSKGSTKTLTATASRTHHSRTDNLGCASLSSVGLNSASVYDNTWWTSNNTSVASVDGYGKVTAKAKGTATITLRYSGTSKTHTVTVP